MPNVFAPFLPMRISRRAILWCAGALVALWSVPASLFAERVLVYDEEKGIVFVDNDAPREKTVASKPARDLLREKPVIKRSEAASPLGNLVDPSIIRGKKKDPSSVYFESGLQYFRAGNYQDALRLFVYADSTDPQPKYALWVGKTYRRLGRTEQQLFIMKKILNIYPDSDVADDALFEIAFYYQAAGDYDKAAKTYTQLTEQYPFGSSFSNGEDFRDVAKKQKQMMRSEMISTLRILGYNGSEAEDLYSSFQQSKGLPVTGMGDQKTVSAIKAEYSDFLKNEDKKAARRVRMAHYINWTTALGCFTLVFAGIMLAVRISATGRKKHVTALIRTLNDLNEKHL
jgi:tetratricopeptide (TPR) repeat protein